MKRHLGERLSALIDGELSDTQRERVLAHLAGLIAANLRAQDVVGRVAGDEFAVLLVGADSSGARAAADHLRAAVSRAPYRQGETDVAFSIRIGLSEITRGEQGLAPSLARAEAALKRSRRRSTEVLVAGPSESGGFPQVPTGDRDALGREARRTRTRQRRRRTIRTRRGALTGERRPRA